MRIQACLIATVVTSSLVFQPLSSSALECPSLLGRYARGWSEAVAANGSEFVFGNGSALVIRHSDGTMAEIEIGAMVLGLDVVDDYAYVVGDGGLRIVDLLASGGPAVVGRCAMPGVAEGVEVLDGLAYVAGGEWGVRMVDVTVPTRPVVVGVVDTPGWAVDVAVDEVEGKPIAAVADSAPGLLIIDAAVDGCPEIVAEAVLGEYETAAVEAFDNHAYVVDRLGDLFSVVDISTPSDPTLVGDLALYNDGGSVSLAMEGVYAYVVGKSFFIVDVANPHRPTRLAQIELGPGGKDVAVSQGQVAVATGSEIRFIDASNPHEPVERDPWRVGENPVQDPGIIATEGHVIGFASETRGIFMPDPIPGLRVFDVSDPARPELVGECLTSHLIGDAEAVGDLVFVVTQDAFFRVLDVSDVSQPREIGSVPLPAAWHSEARFVDLDVDGDLAVVVGRGGLVVIDITDPADPTRLGELLDPFVHVELVGEHAFVAEEDQLRLADLEDPLSPLLVDDDLHRIEALGYVSDFEVVDRYAFVLAGIGGGGFLTVVDVGTETGWTEVALALVPGEIQASQDGTMSLSGNRLALALRQWGVDHRGRLVVFDVSDPGEPLQIADTVMPGEQHAVMASGNNIYVVDGYGGLGVYSLRRCLYSQMEPPDGTAASTQ